MADIPVIESAAETVVVASANGQTVFAFDFLIFHPEQLRVFHSRGDVEVELSYPADFSVSGLEQPNGGSVSLSGISILAGDTLTMRRDTPIERINDWQPEGDYKAALVNNEQDTIFMILQEQKRDVRKAEGVVATMDGRLNTETAQRIAEDASLSGRINKEISDRTNAVANEAYLRDAGDKSVASLIGQAGPIETQVYDTQTAASLSSVKLTVQTVRTGGFSAAGDGGGAIYRRVASEPAHEGKFQSADGAWWELAEKVVTPQMFGARGDGLVDDYPAFQRAMFFRRVHVPAGNYRLSDAVEMPSECTITGDGEVSKLISTGTNKRVLFADGKSGIHVSDLFIEGNLTGLGSTGPGANGGDGISFYDCTDFKVISCIFSKIGNSSGSSFANGLRGTFANGGHVDKNLFLEDCGGQPGNSGADISFGYYSSNLTITDNVSRSTMDIFIGVASVGTDGSGDTDNHIITGNRGYRAAGASGRHGILAPYAAKSTYAVVSNNLMVGFNWCGIYVSAGNGEDIDSAGLTITGNIIRYCGGGSVQNISAGIYVAGRNGAVCSSNLIEFSGFDPSGAPRAYQGAGIKATNTSRDIVISDNVVKDSKNYGVSISHSHYGYVVQNCIVSGNLIKDSGSDGVYIAVSGTAGLHDALVQGNTIISEKHDANGIRVVYGSGATDLKRLKISNNIITSYISSAASDGIVHTLTDGAKNVLISHNQVTGFNSGIRSISFLTDKKMGKEIILEGNVLEDCQYGFRGGVSGVNYGLHFGTTFINCTQNVSDVGRMLAASQLGDGVFEIRRATPPADGAWSRGDKVIFTTPSASGHIGAVCVASGEPGTWKNYGSITA